MGRHRKGVPAEERQATYEAIATDRQASKTLSEAHARGREVENLTDALRRIRERNHFGEMVRRALDGTA